MFGIIVLVCINFGFVFFGAKHLKTINLSTHLFCPKHIILQLNKKIFSFYLIFGGLLRIGEFCGFQSHVIITEYFLYFFAFLAIPFVKCVFSRQLVIVCFLIAFSSFCGAMQYGFDWPSFLYAVRLILIIISGVVFGRILFVLFGPNFQYFSKYFCSIYSCNLLLGFGLLLCFPDSVYLWKFLSSMHIEFDGDPHCYRLISTYFDPNFYGAIGCIPFIFSYCVYKNSRRLKDFLLFCFFSTGVILTWSRSGITTFVLLLISIAGVNFLRQKVLRFDKQKMPLFIIVVVVFFIVCCIYREALVYFVNRFIGMKQDPSAQDRFDSFSLGFSILKSNWILGTGYNYLFVGLSNKSIPILHSSLLISVVSFGIPIMVFFTVLLLFWFFRMGRSVKVLSAVHSDFSLMLQCFLIYLVICFCFSSNFNNLLFFPFWLFPIISIFSYFSSYIVYVSKNVRGLSLEAIAS